MERKSHGMNIGRYVTPGGDWISRFGSGHARVGSRVTGANAPRIESKLTLDVRPADSEVCRGFLPNRSAARADRTARSGAFEQVDAGR